MPSKPGETKQDRQDRYIETLQYSISDKDALDAANIKRRTLEEWLKEPEFNQRHREATYTRGNTLEEGMLHVRDWAVQPDRYSQILRYPQLLMFALRGLKPEKYAERTLLAAGQAQDDLKKLLSMDDTPAETNTVSLPVKGPEKGKESDWFDSLLAGVSLDDNAS